MPKASLLLRETLSSSSLTNIVEKSQNQKPPYSDYDIKFNSTKLDLVLLKPNPGPGGYHPVSQQHPDEGFESDIDSLSLISSDESFTSSTCLVEDHALKHQHQETDSANGSSSSSESDTEHPGGAPTTTTRTSFPLNDVLCYTDVTYPKVLVFVIKDDVFVFSFDDLEYLRSFHTSFNTLKAVTNQRTYGNPVNLGAKFNLLQRTDSNGVTHIEITQRGGNTPEEVPKNVTLDDSRIYLENERKSSRSDFYPKPTVNSFTLRPGYPTGLKDTDQLLKSWKSAESLLTEEPKRPERKRKPKGRAPPPPNQNPSNVMKGQYVRVAVDPKTNPEKPYFQTIQTIQTFQTFGSNVQTFTPNWNNIRTPHSPLVLDIQRKHEYKKNEEPMRHQHSWTNSVPRLLRKQRSKSETRPNLTPMAYRYIDTTQNLPKGSGQHFGTASTISNRLFGLSQKLKEFGTNVVAKETPRGFTSYYEPEQRRNSLGEMTYRKNSSEANLKSVIKKDDKKKSEKKVTFSAYATVQVV